MHDLEAAFQGVAMAMVRRWLHLSELGGDGWIYPIWTAMQAANAGTRLSRTEDLFELGVHISTRLTLLPRVVRRINEGTRKLYLTVEAHAQEHEFTRDRPGRALCVNADIKYELLVDIDSLLFELNSACELICRLFENIHTVAGISMPAASAGTSLRTVVKASGTDPAWFTELDKNRNFFIHEGAPYFAIDISAPPAYDLLLMKENLKIFDDHSKFIRLSQIYDIYRGFLGAARTVQVYIVKLFKPDESPLSS